jgi:1,4-dihydroxy-2-naphthoyl-CoA hydrolase
MAIWFQAFELAQLNARRENSLDAALGVTYSAFGDNWLAATMPVDGRTRQPFGLLHGGASAALAESLGSVGANLCIDPARFGCVGQSLTVNHVSSARSGLITGTARPRHLGGRSQVWQIEMRGETDDLVCLATLTIAVLTAR